MNLILPTEFSETEIFSLLPQGAEAHLATSLSGRALLRSRRNGLLHLVAKEALESAMRGYRGRQKNDVSSFYEGTYDENALTETANRDFSMERQNIYRIGSGHLVRTRSSEVARIWTRRLGDIIGALGQETVSEVGCGNGRNLLYLANRFAGIRFGGYELSAAGTEVARQLQSFDLPSTGYGRHYGITPQGMENIGRIDFRQASAFDLPCEDASRDVVYTFAALEQMGDGLDTALAEIRRVTRRYTLFFEPFWDYNDRLGRAYLWSRNYFRLRTADLRKHGFELMRTWYVLPVKPTFAYAFVLCKPV